MCSVAVALCVCVDTQWRVRWCFSIVFLVLTLVIEQKKINFIYFNKVYCWTGYVKLLGHCWTFSRFERAFSHCIVVVVIVDDEDNNNNNKSNWIFPLKTTDCVSLMMRWHKARCLCGKWILQVDLCRAYSHSDEDYDDNNNNNNDKSNCERCFDSTRNDEHSSCIEQERKPTTSNAPKLCVNLRLQPYLCKIYLKHKRDREKSER